MNTKTKRSTKAAKKDDIVSQIRKGALKLLGEVVCWNASGGTHTHATVLAGLQAAGLNDKVARELLPKHAFTRAMRALKDERVIDPLNDSGYVLYFQFTKRFMEQGEWKYGKDTTLELNTITGKVKSVNKKLEALAQEKLDHAIEARTASDITKIIQRLFEAEADLFPVRDQGGVYFVPDQFTAFTAKVEQFLEALGGRLSRFPVPADTRQGDRSTRDAVADGLRAVVVEYEEAIDKFGLTTRTDTLEAAAERIKATRVKAEAYASYLDDRRQEVLDALEAAQEKLRVKVHQLGQEREKAPVVSSENGPTRAFVCGHPVTKVLRWMGAQGWSNAEARRVLDQLIGIGEIKGATIATQVGAGRRGSDAYGPMINLSPEQATKLNDLRLETVDEDPSDPSPEEQEAAGVDSASF